MRLSLCLESEVSRCQENRNTPVLTPDPPPPRLTDSRFCEEHQRIENQRYEKYDRDPAVKRRYGQAWKHIRDRYMNTHPLCEQCQKEGRLTKADQVHHIKPLAEDSDHSETNLMSLCSSCHSKIHAERGDRWHGKSHPQRNGF